MVYPGGCHGDMAPLAGLEQFFIRRRTGTRLVEDVHPLSEGVHGRQIVVRHDLCPTITRHASLILSTTFAT